MIGRRKFLAGTAGVFSGLALGPIASIARQEDELVTLHGETMGTYYNITLPYTNVDTAALKLGAFETLAEVDGLMSTYKPQSEISRFNAADPHASVQISSQTSFVIQQSRHIADLTQGAFDVTIGPLVELWGFGASGRMASIPDAEKMSQTARRVGMDALQTRQDAAWKTRPDLALDLNGIAKGYAVDQLARLLDEQGVAAYLVDIGGELRAKGRKPNGQRWKVGIERPVQGTRAVHRIVALEDQAIATSGDYRNAFVQGGQNYTHVIDPRTAQPVTHALASVTVLGRDTLTADALSTALMVMGPDKGLQFAQTHDIPAYFLVREDNRLVDRHTASFSSWIGETV